MNKPIKVLIGGCLVPYESSKRVDGRSKYGSDNTGNFPLFPYFITKRSFISFSFF